jgi:transposase
MRRAGSSGRRYCWRRMAAPDEAIATNVGVGGSTVYRTKRRFVLGNLEAALSEEPRPGANRKLSGKEEALLVAKRRNAECARINWMFTTQKARAKMERAYPKPTLKSDQNQRVKTSVTRYLVACVVESVAFF